MKAVQAANLAVSFSERNETAHVCCRKHWQLAARLPQVLLQCEDGCLTLNREPLNAKL